MTSTNDENHTGRPNSQSPGGHDIVSIILGLIPYAVFWKAKDLRYLGCNKVFSDHAGLDSPDDIVGLSDFDLPWSAEETEAYRIDDRAVMSSNEPRLHIIETQHTAEGRRTWVDTSKVPLLDPSGAVVGVLGVYADITEYRENDLKLAEARNHLEAAINAMDSGIVMYDREERLVFCNDRYRQIYSSANDLMVPGKTYEEILQQYASADPRISAKDAGAWILERLEQHRRCQGEWIQDLGDKTIRVSDKRLANGGTVSLRTDISAFKAIENQLREARDQAESANAAKSQFLANMSHEIRTPMTAILGFTDMLLSGDLEDPIREALRTIRKNGEGLLSLMNDILDLSKVEARRIELELEVVEFADVLEDIVDLMSVRSHAKGLVLQIEFVEPIPRRIRTDPRRVKQVLVNLVSNAIKFTERGRVSIRPTWHEVDGQVVVAIEVVDEGIGMTQEQVARIFQPFEQADLTTTRKYGGTGLGLAISQRFARLLEGQIEVTSQPGLGSTFRFEFAAGPVDRSDLFTPESRTIGRPTLGPARAPKAKKPLTGRRILLVEDGRDNQRLIAFVLKRAGADVSLASNGQEALDAIAEDSNAEQPFDLVLMDMQMPVLDGYEATHRLRAAGFRTPILALTANAMEGDREGCLEAGCDDYVSKPVSFELLVDTCLDWLQRDDRLAG